MSPRFRDFVEGFVFKWECAYDRAGNVTWENVPGDTGGLTKYGIDQASHPEVDIKRLTAEQALAIYHEDYWRRIKGDAMPDRVGEVLMDIAVNNGYGRAARWLQEIVGVTVDGVIGPVTLAAAHSHHPADLTQRLLDRREHFYHAIAKGSKEKFLRGWINRNEALRDWITITAAG